MFFNYNYIHLSQFNEIDNSRLKIKIQIMFEYDEYDEHFVIESLYKVWVGMPDNAASNEIRLICGDESIISITEDDAFLVKTTQSKMLSLKKLLKDKDLIVSRKTE
jgi:hypothetical protein